MPFVLVRIRVADYTRWKRVREEHVTKRTELGSRGTRIFRNAETPDEVVCLTEWRTFEKAREFMSWGDPEEIRTRSGVLGSADVLYLDAIESLPA